MPPKQLIVQVMSATRYTTPVAVTDSSYILVAYVALCVLLVYQLSTGSPSKVSYCTGARIRRTFRVDTAT